MEGTISVNEEGIRS